MENLHMNHTLKYFGKCFVLYLVVGLAAFLSPVVGIILAITSIPLTLSWRKKLKSERAKESTLYQKERVIQKGSMANQLLTSILISLWLIGGVSLFYEVTPWGIACLGIAAFWTYQRINRSKIENFEKIVTPPHWPKDCQYADYNQGLQAKTRFAGSTKDQAFYNKCKAEGIEDLNSESKRQKALLVAQVMKRKDLTAETIPTAFHAGKLAAEKSIVEGNAFAREQELSKIRIDELQVLAGSMKYYGLQGKEKRTTMLQDMYEEAKKAKKDAENMKALAQSTFQQKEHSWATHGGIASGIAGPAAGLVAAMRVEAKNAAIREYNAQMAPYVGMISNSCNQQRDYYTIQMQQYRKDIEKTKVKLVSDDSMTAVFKHLHISNMDYAISETGAVVVEADFHVAPDYRIFGDIAPTVDGVVAAKLMENGEHVGSAYFVFPVDGVHKKIRLASICTKTTNPTAKYTVEYEPVYLWAMEKL